MNKTKICHSRQIEVFEIKIEDSGFSVEIVVSIDDGGEYTLTSINIDDVWAKWDKVFFKNLKKAIPLIEKKADEILKKINKENIKSCT